MKNALTKQWLTRRLNFVKLAVASLLIMAAVAAGLNSLQGPVRDDRPLAGLFPDGPLLYIESRDFAGLLKEWNDSPENAKWIKSDNHASFENSRLFLGLQKVQQEFAKAAGVPLDVKFAATAAGQESALALYDIGKVEFLYVTRMPSSAWTDSMLWNSRNKFETRSVGSLQFYVRKNEESERSIAFAMVDGYLLLATREDLMAGALELLSGTRVRSLRDDAWFANALQQAHGQPGDLRMVLNLEKIVVDPHFRTYWLPQNITEMKRYASAVSDFYRSGDEYREERVLLKALHKTADEPAPSDAQRALAGQQAAGELGALVPADVGVYQVEANPTPGRCLELLRDRILLPHNTKFATNQDAPSANLDTGEVGSPQDLESRIDEAPVQRISESGDLNARLKLIEAAGPRALLQVQSTRRNGDGVLLTIASGIVIESDKEWNSGRVHEILSGIVTFRLTASQLGTKWKATADGTFALDGLSPLLVATSGKLLFVSNDAVMMTSLRARGAKPLPAATYLAGFSHASESRQFVDLTRVLDRSAGGDRPGSGEPHVPEFFSGNVASLSHTFSEMDRVTVTTTDSDTSTSQTVKYHWRR